MGSVWRCGCSFGELVALVFVVAITSAAAQAPAPEIIRISCGSSHDYTTTEYSWRKDFGFSGGSVGNLTAELVKDSGFTNLRYFSGADGPNGCYNISIPNGHYLIRFMFGYGQTDNAGREPQFDVSIEGTLGFALKPGWSSNEDTRYADALIFVEDSVVTACLHSTGHGTPALVTLEVLQLYENAYDLGFGLGNHDYLLIANTRVSCGATKAAYGTSLGADIWGGDRYWSKDVYKYAGDNVAFVDSLSPIRHSNIPPNFYPAAIYQGATITKWGGGVSYAFPIESSQNYSIWLHFAEIGELVTGTGQRVFDIFCNDQLLFGNVDIWGQAGGANAALVLNKTVHVDGNTLMLSFKPVFGDILVCAIEVYQIMPLEFATRVEERWGLQAMKPALDIPPRMGWIGDPCVPKAHPWGGVDCSLDVDQEAWVISGLDMQNQGLTGSLSEDVSALTSIKFINLNDNSLQGQIPTGVGNLTNITRLDLANNQLNGTIPDSLGTLHKLKELYLNNNDLSGKVPPTLAAGPVRGASFNFLGNRDLCGLPGLRSCRRMSTGAVVGIVFASIFGCALIALCGYIIWKRRENIARTNKILTTGDAPYAASHTQARGRANVKDVQLSRFGSFTEQRLMRADSNTSM